MIIENKSNIDCFQSHNGETLVKSTHACFPATHPHIITFAGLSVDLPTSGSNKKLTSASFFTNTFVRMNIYKKEHL